MKTLNIIIKKGNENRMQEALDRVQKRSHVREMTVQGIFDIVLDLEKKFSDIPKKSLIGTIAEIDRYAEVFPSAYKYTPESTHIKMERTSGGWKLIDVFRDNCNGTNKEFYICLSESAKQALVESYSRF